MLTLLMVEDNRSAPGAAPGLEATGAVRVAGEAASGEEALAYCLAAPPQVVLMDVQLATGMNGIAAAVAIRREFPACRWSSTPSRTTTPTTATSAALAS